MGKEKRFGSDEESSLSSSSGFFRSKTSLSEGIAGVNSYVQKFKGVEDNINKLNISFSEYEKVKAKVMAVVKALETSEFHGKSSSSYANEVRLLDSLSHRLLELDKSIHECQVDSRKKMSEHGIESSELNGSFKKLNESMRREQAYLKDRYDKIGLVSSSPDRFSHP